MSCGGSPYTSYPITLECYPLRGEFTLIGGFHTDPKLNLLLLMALPYDLISTARFKFENNFSKHF